MTQQIFMTADGLAEHLMTNVRKQAIWTPMTAGMAGGIFSEIRSYFDTALAASRSQLEPDEHGQPTLHLDIDLENTPGTEFPRTLRAIETAAQNTRFR